jgi:hypothetical protein
MGCGAQEQKPEIKVLTTKDVKFICKLQNEEGDDMLIQPIGSFGEPAFPAKITYETKKGRGFCLASDKVYFSGGEETGGEFGVIDINFAQRRTKVSFMQSLLVERGFHNMATVNDNMLIVLGGMSKHKEGFLPTAEVYHINRDKWIAIAPMHFGRCGMGVTSFRSRFVYCFGGYINIRDATNSIDYYDILTNTWTPVTLTDGTLAKKHGHMACQMNSDEILVFGGEKSEEDTPTYVFNVVKKAITKILPAKKLEGIISESPLPVIRHRTRAYVIDPQKKVCHMYSHESQTWNIIRVYTSP